MKIKWSGRTRIKGKIAWQAVSPICTLASSLAWCLEKGCSDSKKIERASEQVSSIWNCNFKWLICTGDLVSRSFVILILKSSLL